MRGLTTAASLILCWAAYLGGEALHVSGVISTVTAGLVFGWYQHVVFTAGVRIRSSAFWHVMVFLFEATGGFVPALNAALQSLVTSGADEGVTFTLNLALTGPVVDASGAAVTSKGKPVLFGADAGQIVGFVDTDNSGGF